MLYFTKKTLFYKKKKCQEILPTTMLAYLVINNIFVSDIYIIANMKCQLCHLHLEQDFIQQNIFRISDIYVSITEFLHQLIYISWGRNNSQHSMLDNPDYNNISIDKYYRNIFQTFMLSLHVYVTRSFTMIYLEVISIIQG